MNDSDSDIPPSDFHPATPPPLPVSPAESTPDYFDPDPDFEPDQVFKEDVADLQDEQAPVARPDYALLDIVKAVFLVILFAILMGVAVGVFALFWSTVTNNSSYAQIVNSSIRYINTGFSLSLVYVAWLFRCSKYGKTPREGLALRKVGWKTNVGAIFLGMILGTFSYFIALLHSAAQPSVMNNAPITKMITSPGGQITFLLLILVAPPCEEIFFRGFLFPVLRNKWGLVAGVVLSSFAFAYIHGYQVNRDVVSLSVIFMIGLVFALERQKFHSTIPSILTHWTYNITVAALGVIVMGLMAFQHAKPRPTVVHRSIPSSEEVKKDLLGHVIGKSGKMPWSFDSLSEFKQFAPTGKKETSHTLDLSYTVYLKGSIGPWSRANIVVHYRQVGTGYVFAGVDDYHSLTVMKK